MGEAPEPRHEEDTDESDSSLAAGEEHSGPLPCALLLTAPVPTAAHCVDEETRLQEWQGLLMARMTCSWLE